jgi:hypothetical protein
MKPLFRCALFSPLLLVTVLPTAPVPAQDPSKESIGSDRPALTIARDAAAESQVVGIGRDVVIDGTVSADVAALQGSVRLSGSVTGDVIVLGGDARLATGARVGGDVFVLGGSLEAEPGAVVVGQSVSYPDASEAWLLLLEGPAFGLEPTAPVVLAAKTALLTAWLALTLALFLIAGRGVLGTAETVRQEPIRSFFVGLTGVLALTLTAVFLGAFAGPWVGLPLVVLVALLLLALKLWGVVTVFYVVGGLCLGYLPRRRPHPRPLDAACVGLLLLGALKFWPTVGSVVWMLISLIGVGAALSSKFGRHEPWLEQAAA